MSYKAWSGNLISANVATYNAVNEASNESSDSAGWS
jgi:hypothetical protein